MGSFLLGRIMGRNDNVCLSNPTSAQTRPSGIDLLQSGSTGLGATQLVQSLRMVRRTGPVLVRFASFHFLPMTLPSNIQALVANTPPQPVAFADVLANGLFPFSKVAS